MWVVKGRKGFPKGTEVIITRERANEVGVSMCTIRKPDRKRSRKIRRDNLRVCTSLLDAHIGNPCIFCDFDETSAVVTADLQPVT